MHNFIDRTGQRYGRVIVLERAPDQITPKGLRQVQWLCRCDCGNTTVIASRHLGRSASRSCGCLMRDRASATHITHGMSKKSEYRIWQHMHRRCLDPSNPGFKYYGERGITVCDRWRDFNAFYADMGPRPSLRHSIDRIRNDLGYSPENCRWATYHEQSRNTRRTRLVKFQGVEMCVADAAALSGINRATISLRLSKGWPESALFIAPSYLPREARASTGAPPAAV